MISNQILQSTLNGVKDITGNEFCLYDADGHKVAGTFKPQNADKGLKDEILKFVDEPEDDTDIGDHSLIKLYDDHQVAYVLAAYGEDRNKIGRLCIFQLENLMFAHREKYDKDNFIRSLLMDNLLLVDIYSRAQKLRIATDVRRVVYIVESEKGRDIRKDLFAACASKSFPLIGMEPSGMSLEEVFIKLTGSTGKKR